MTFTPDLNLGNLLITGALTGIGYGLIKLYTLISEGIDLGKQALDDIDDHAEVINMHTTLFVDHGLAKGSVGIPRVEERRRRSRIHSGH